MSNFIMKDGEEYSKGDKYLYKEIIKTNSLDTSDQVVNNEEPIYVETIKDKKDRPKHSFIRSAAGLIVVCVFGGYFVGAGIGSANFIINRVFTDNQEHIEELGSSEFSFDVGVVDNAVDTVSNQTATYTGAESLADLVNRVEPSIVAINSTIPGSYSSVLSPFYPSYNNQGSGSGVIFHEDEEHVYISTNYHVVEGASEVVVSISNGEELSEPIKARLIGREPSADLAVIAISKEDMKNTGITSVKLAEFGDSDSMQVGDQVVAIGNALGEGNSITNGIISAKNKEVTVEGKTLSVLQTNAAINPGNSGGALINLKGEVIGINTAKLSESSVEGMAYSISSNIAKPIIESLMVPKPMLGIMGMSLTQDIANRFNLPAFGVIIESVTENGSAYKAGIKSYDIITSFNDEPVFDMQQLQTLISEVKIGDEINVKVLREGRTDMTFKVIMEGNSDNSF